MKEHPGYQPQTEYERELFPYLGRARVIDGPSEYIGREGTIIHEDGDREAKIDGYRVVRIAFDNFWHRPDGMDAVEADDAGYFFDGEYERLETMMQELKASELIAGKRYKCSCPVPLEGEFWKIDDGLPVFLIGPRVSSIALNYEKSSCTTGWYECEN